MTGRNDKSYVDYLDGPVLQGGGVGFLESEVTYATCTVVSDSNLRASQMDGTLYSRF